MESKLSEKVSALKAALKTVRYQITHLQPHFSKEQVICWKRYRKKLLAQLREFEKALALQQRDASKVTAFVNTHIHNKRK
jgi:hypothetical protein